MIAPTQPNVLFIDHVAKQGDIVAFVCPSVNALQFKDRAYAFSSMIFLYLTDKGGLRLASLSC